MEIKLHYVNRVVNKFAIQKFTGLIIFICQYFKRFKFVLNMPIQNKFNMSSHFKICRLLLHTLLLGCFDAWQLKG